MVHLKAHDYISINSSGDHSSQETSFVSVKDSYTAVEISYMEGIILGMTSVVNQKGNDRDIKELEAQIKSLIEGV